MKINKEIKPKIERFVMLQEDTSIAKVENLAKKTGCTKSWVYRVVLVALEKKFADKLPDSVIVQRPKKFKEHFRQTTICMYGDRSKWFSLCRIWLVELGPLIRFGLELYESGELELDLEDERSVKEIKKINIGLKVRFHTKNIRYRYMYQSINLCYRLLEFWPKNSSRNLVLMKRGLENRKYPLILETSFKIPKCFNL